MLRIAEAEHEALEAIERRELEKNGIAELERTLGGLQSGIAGAEAEIAEKNGELKTLDDKQQVLSDPAGDDEYRQVVEMMANALGREDLRTLWNEARRTPTPEDETIVSDLEKLDQEIERGEKQIEDARKAVLQLTYKRTELEKSRDRFYRSGYDDPGGSFSNGDLIGEVIGGIIGGAMSSGSLDDVFREGFRRAGTAGRGRIGGGIRMPSPGPWTGGGPSRSPRPAPQPAPRSRGGFRTGGSF